MRASIKINDLFGILLFAAAFAISVIYILFSAESLLHRQLITDAIENGLLCLFITAGLILYLIVLPAACLQTRAVIISSIQQGIRFFLSFIFFYYAFIKICGNMFYTPLATLDKPVFQLNGFELTWRFFGYSVFYNGFIIFLQLICASLLLNRQTALLGALLGIGMMLNISVLNFTHHIQLKLYSVIYVLMLCYFILSHPVIRMVFPLNQSSKNIDLPLYLQLPMSKASWWLRIYFSACLLTMFTKELQLRAANLLMPAFYGIWKISSTADTALLTNQKLMFDKGSEGTVKNAHGDEQYFEYQTDKQKSVIYVKGGLFPLQPLQLRYFLQGDSVLMLYSNDSTLYACLKKQL